MQTFLDARPACEGKDDCCLIIPDRQNRPISGRWPSDYSRGAWRDNVFVERLWLSVNGGGMNLSAARRTCLQL
jgi:hypothetical protein